jgi:hypothetical protein
MLPTINEKGFATKPKGEQVDVYYGWDEDGYGYFLVDTELLVWSCEKVVAEQKGNNFKFNESMLKEEIGLVIGFQHEVYLKRFVGKIGELKKLMVKMVKKKLREEKEYLEKELECLEKDCQASEWNCLVPMPGSCGPAIFEKPKRM